MNELSIVVPCIYSIDMLPEFIDKLAVYLMANPGDMDLIVVANQRAGSPEAIIEYVRKRYPWLKFEFLQRAGGIRSYGALARFGIAYSSNSYVVLVSPYGDDNLDVIPRMLNEIRKGAQVIQATRYADAQDREDIPLKFRFYQLIYRASTKLLLGFNINDSTYAFKMFDRVFVQALGLTQNGFSISPEITFKTLLAGGTVRYISSNSKTSPINKDFKLYKEGIGYIWLLIRGFLHRIGVLWF